MMWLKACPRCKGDLLLVVYSADDRAVSCLQCGHTLTPAEEQELRALRRPGTAPAPPRPRLPIGRRRGMRERPPVGAGRR